MAGQAYLKQDYVQAYSHYKQAITEAQANNEIYNSIIYEQGQFYIGCLTILRLVGEEAKATDMFLDIAQKLYGTNSIQYANMLDQKARVVWSVNNDLKTAELLFQEAKEIKLKISNNLYSIEYDWSLKNLFWVAAEMDKFNIESDPEYWANKRLKFIIDNYGENSFQTYAHYSLVASKYLEYNSQKALNYFQKVDKIGKVLLENPENITEEFMHMAAQSLVELARLGLEYFKETGNKYFINPESTLSGIEILANSHWRSNGYFNYTILARSYVHKGEFEKGEKYLKEALKSHSQFISLNLTDKASILENYGWTLIQNNKFKEGLDYIMRSLTLYSEIYDDSFKYFTEQEQNNFYYNFYAPAFEKYISAIIQSNKIQDPDVAARLFDYRLITKGIILSQQRKLKQQIDASDNLELKQKYESYVLLKAQYSLLLSSISDSNQIETIKNQIDAIERSINEKLTISTKKEFKWQDIQKGLDSNTAAVEIIRFRNFERDFTDEIGYAAIILKDENNPIIKIIPNGNEIETSLLPNYRNDILKKKMRNLPEDYYNKLWQPIGIELKGISKVYLSIDGAYNLFNLNTFLNPKTGLNLNEEISIELVNKTSDLLNVPSISIAKSTLIGRPKFKIEDNKENINSEQYSITRGIDFSNYEWSDLPGTEEEIDEIAFILSKDNSEVELYKGKDANESNVKRSTNNSILHIATHGYFNSPPTGQDPLHYSGLVLSGVENFYQDNMLLNGEDGLLTSFEVSTLNLENTDLVVLSACETGLGEVQNGEGVYGLQRAFQIAGAKYILMSLWSVDDLATKDFMIAFYQHLVKTEDVVESYNHAMSEMKLKYILPYKWGAFVLLQG